MTNQALDHFITTSVDEINSFMRALNSEAIEAAAELILNARSRQNRVHITGIGKPGHVAGYVASLLSSTGTPTYFLHGTEAVHGSCGQLIAGDVVICISNSGETLELKATVNAVKNNGCKIIAVTGYPDSWLAKEADVLLQAGVSNEGGPLNRAPRASVVVEILALQALSVVLQAKLNVTPETYVKWHPGGSLGKLRDNEV